MVRNTSTKVKKKGATTLDALNSIIKLSHEGSSEPLAVDMYNKLSTGGNLYENLYNFAYDSAYYEPNPRGHQRVRRFERTIHDKRASCVDYSVLIASILMAGGERVFLKLVSTDGFGFGHIYPIARDGTILDVVYGQDESGNEYRTRDANSKAKFNQECAHKAHIIKTLNPMELTELNGTNTINGMLYEINGCPCQNINGLDVPMVVNGSMLELNDGYNDEDYGAYVLAAHLGDETALNGLKDFINKRREKRADRKEAKAEEKADKKEAKANRRTKRKGIRDERRERWGSVVDKAVDFLAAKGKELTQDQLSQMDALDEMGIDPSDEEMDRMLRGAEGGEKSSMLPLIGLAAIALFALKK